MSRAYHVGTDLESDLFANYTFGICERCREPLLDLDLPCFTCRYEADHV